MLQGMLSNRWGPSDALRRAGAKIEALPQKFAAWEMKKAEKMGEDALNQLQPAGYIQRLYVHRDSGAAVSVTVMVGMSGPISGAYPRNLLRQPRSPTARAAAGNARSLRHGRRRNRLEDDLSHEGDRRPRAEYLLRLESRRPLGSRGESAVCLRREALVVQNPIGQPSALVAQR